MEEAGGEMKYSIFYLIKGEAGKYNQKLLKTIGPKNGENYMIENPLPSHVTLKSPFEIDNIREIEEFLDDFVKKQKQSRIEIDGFGNFRRFVAFLKVKFSVGAKKIQKNLVKELQEFGIKAHEFDLKWDPHATISYGNTKESFNGIWKDLKKLNKPHFDLKFENITIMKRVSSGWKVHKEFKIK
jgi:2'-5' RNA ligase